MDYFTIFDLPFSYSTNLKQLTSRYQELQLQYHPDRFVNQSKSNKLAALQRSVTINTAYEVLKDPLKRAEYMLTFYNIDINSKSEQYIMHDIAFLTKQFELREELALIETNERVDELLVLFSSNLTKMITSYLQKIEKQLNNKEWINAASTVCKLRFLDKLQRQIKQLEERLLDIF